MSPVVSDTSKLSNQPPENTIHVLCLHGWLDNANSFDVLVPRLFGKLGAHPSRPNLKLLSLDMAGHGLSDHLPRHSDYLLHVYARDIVFLFDRHLTDWPSSNGITLLAHSMGGAVSTLLASSFPERFSHLILIENLGPLTRLASHAPTALRQHILQRLAMDSKSPPIYDSLQQSIDARQRGTSQGTLSLLGAQLLCDRGLKQAASSTGSTTAKLTWRTDQQLVSYSGISYTEPQVLAHLQSIKCPTLLIAGSRGYGFSNTDTATSDSQQNNPNNPTNSSNIEFPPANNSNSRDNEFPWIDFRARWMALGSSIKKKVVVEGGHHLHMDEKGAEETAGLVARFLTMQSGDASHL